MKALVVYPASYRIRRWKSPDGSPASSWSFAFRVESEDGPQRIRRSGFASKSAAAQAAKLEAERLRTETRKPTASDAPKTLHALVERYLSEACGHLRAKSRKCERNDLALVKARTPDVALSELDGGHLQRYVATRTGEEVSPFAIRREGGAFRRAVRFAVRRGWIRRDPLGEVRLPKLPELSPCAPSREEVARLVKEATGYLRPLVLLCATCGLRRGEALRLRWEDLDASTGTLRVASRSKGLTKSGRGRVVALPKETARALEAWRQEATPSPWVFPNPTGRSHLEWIDEPWRALRTRAGVTCTLHQLRHFFALEVAKAGCAGVTLQAVLGHATLAVTQKYLRGSESLSAQAGRFAPSFALDGPDPDPSGPEASAPEASAAVVELTFTPDHETPREATQ